MLKRLFTRKLLSPADLAPSQDDMQVVGVLNPGVVRFGGRVWVLARVVEQPVEGRAGFYASPVMRDGRIEMDWLPADQFDAISDPRTYRHRCGGGLRLRFISHLALFSSADGLSIDPVEAPVRLLPADPVTEVYGIEDPRITVIGHTAYITYVAVSPHGVATALMSTTDFRVFERHGIIFCPDNKDVVLFPEKVGGDYLAMHRPMQSMGFGPPELWLARSADLLHWGDHRRLNLIADPHHRDRVGGGSPPVRTGRGWLTLYHGSDRLPGAAGVGRYTAGALLLDHDDPTRVVARSDGPVLVPEKRFETHGFVDNVVFPTAMVKDGDRWLVYCGAADEHVTVVGMGETGAGVQGGDG